MAIDQGTTTLAVTSQERTWRIDIETARLADPVVTGYRQVVRTAADGSLIAIAIAPSTQRNLSAVATATLPFTPATAGVITGAELAGLISAWIDVWRTQDIATAAAAAAAQSSTSSTTSTPAA